MFDSFNLTENSHYASVGLPTKYGPWFLLEYQNQDLSTAYRYQAIMQIINQTRSTVAPIGIYTCSGILPNSSLACNGTSMCVSQDTCQAFPAPTSPDDSTFTTSPTSGVGLIQNFLIETDAWTSVLPLQYAFGIVAQSTQNMVLTTYSSLPWTLTILPYTGSALQIVVFVKDSLGNVYTKISTQTVNVTPFEGNATTLQTIMQNFTQTDKIIAFYDKSPASATFGSHLIDTIDLTSGKVGLANLESITNILNNNNNSNSQQMLTSITNKLTTYLSNSSLILTQSQTQSVVNTISNMYSNAPNSSNQLLQSLASLLLTNGQFQVNSSLYSTSLPSLQYTSPKFNLTMASFNLSSYQTPGQYVNYSDISMDLSEIFSGLASSAAATKGGVSLIKYAADDTSITQSLKANKETLLSETLQLKFYANSSLKKVSGLKRPIKLRFVLRGSVDLKKTSSKLTILCKYLDEKKSNWTSDGCVLGDFNMVTRVVTCNCNHTTTFGILSDTSSLAVSTLWTQHNTCIITLLLVWVIYALLDDVNFFT